MGHEKQQSQILEAVEGAKAGDVVSYLEHLAASLVLDGIQKKLAADWPKTDRHEIHDAISTGTDSLYNKLSSGGLITNPVGYLYAAARKQLAGRLRDQPAMVPLNDNIRDRAPLPGEEVPDEVPDFRSEALRTARGLLPKLGLVNVQAVMKVIFDALEADIPHLDNEAICEITGLAPETVRRAKSRGWQRLSREARKIGIELPSGQEGDEDESGD